MSKRKGITDIRAIARNHTETAIKALVTIASREDSPPSARVAAASCLLDRGWGRAPQDIHVKGQLEQSIIGMVADLDKRTVPAPTSDDDMPGPDTTIQ